MQIEKYQDAGTGPNSSELSIDIARVHGFKIENADRVGSVSHRRNHHIRCNEVADLHADMPWMSVLVPRKTQHYCVSGHLRGSSLYELSVLHTA